MYILIIQESELSLTNFFFRPIFADKIYKIREKCLSKQFNEVLVIIQIL